VPARTKPKRTSSGVMIEMPPLTPVIFELNVRDADVNADLVLSAAH